MCHNSRMAETKVVNEVAQRFVTMPFWRGGYSPVTLEAISTDGEIQGFRVYGVSKGDTFPDACTLDRGAFDHLVSVMQKAIDEGRA